MPLGVVRVIEPGYGSSMPNCGSGASCVLVNVPSGSVVDHRLLLASIDVPFAPLGAMVTRSRLPLLSVKSSWFVTRPAPEVAAGDQLTSGSIPPVAGSAAVLLALASRIAALVGSASIMRLL